MFRNTRFCVPCVRVFGLSMFCKGPEFRFGNSSDLIAAATFWSTFFTAVRSLMFLPSSFSICRLSSVRNGIQSVTAVGDAKPLRNGVAVLGFPNKPTSLHSCLRKVQDVRHDSVGAGLPSGKPNRAEQSVCRTSGKFHISAFPGLPMFPVVFPGT